MNTEAYDLGQRAGRAARNGDWSLVNHLKRGAPKISDPAYADYKAGYASVQPDRLRIAKNDARYGG